MAKSKRMSDNVLDIKAAMDEAFAKHLIKTQAKLARDNPVDTGRMASSWFIGKDNPNRAVRPDGWAEPGAKRVEVERFNGRIEFDGTWYISNNLPYAHRVAYDSKWSKGGRTGPAWFTQITDQQVNDMNEAIRRALPK